MLLKMHLLYHFFTPFLRMKFHGAIVGIFILCTPQEYSSTVIISLLCSTISSYSSVAFEIFAEHNYFANEKFICEILTKIMIQKKRFQACTGECIDQYLKLQFCFCFWSIHGTNSITSCTNRSVVSLSQQKKLLHDFGRIFICFRLFAAGSCKAEQKFENIFLHCVVFQYIFELCFEIISSFFPTEKSISIFLRLLLISKLEKFLLTGDFFFTFLCRFFFFFCGK